MRAACARAGHPEAAFPAVHVAGTNGKGSVCAMVEAIARAQGSTTGLYTSPHLCRFAERIRIDGEPVSDELLAALLERALDAGPDLSFFETATLAAFLAFRDAEVDLAVLEVGIGGRLDATNVIPDPARGRHHAHRARSHRSPGDHAGGDRPREGRDRQAGPRHRAGDACPRRARGHRRGGQRARSHHELHRRRAISRRASAWPARTSETTPASPPALASRIGASTGAIEEGLADVKWPGRLERIGRRAARRRAQPRRRARPSPRTCAPSPSRRPRSSWSSATLADKDWAPMLDALAPLRGPTLLRRSRGRVAQRHRPRRHGRAPSRHRLPFPARRPGGPGRVPLPESLVVVAGSMVLVGQARALLLGLPRDPPVAL